MVVTGDQGRLDCVQVGDPRRSRGCFCMRHHVRTGTAVCVAMLVCVTGGAHAQSFFEKLFGLGPQRPVTATTVPAPTLKLGRMGGGDGVSGVSTRELRARGDDEAGFKQQSLQTMCVRTCDGYYWPVRYPATRADFAADAQVCASSCGAQAKLYYRAGPQADPHDMRDADGLSYASTPTAFAYRRGLVNGCACRAMPWSDSERARHEGYALAEAERSIRVA